MEDELRWAKKAQELGCPYLECKRLNRPWFRRSESDRLGLGWLDECTDGVRFIIGATVSLWAKRERAKRISASLRDRTIKWAELNDIEEQAEAFALKERVRQLEAESATEGNTTK